METRCQKCGAAVGADQAFCPRCGAVIGMSDASPRDDEGWDLAATMTGRQSPAAAARPGPSAERPSAEQPSSETHADAAHAREGGNAVRLAVIGFVAVLLVGGLLVLLLYLNSQG